MRQYIIPDSDSRSLTEEELWSWDYESIGFFNEIFARHGYCFEAGGKYDNYFRSRPWYTPNANPDNSRACYPQLNAVEWSNEKLCKEVRASMRALHTSNRQGKHYLDYVTTDAFDVLSLHKPEGGAKADGVFRPFRPVLARSRRKSLRQHQWVGLCGRLGKRMAIADV